MLFQRITDWGLRPKRLAAVALASAVAMGSLAACSSGGGQSGTSGEAGGKVTLQYAIWDKNQQATAEKIVAAYTAEHPDVTVNVQLTGYGDYFTKLQTSVSGNSGPDVFWMNGPNFQLYASNGMLAPLGVDASNYPEALVNLYTYDGQTYGAPKDFDTIAVFYNKALFDAAGVDYPKDGWTWADYLDAAKKLTDKDKGIYGSVLPASTQEGVYNTIPQAGGEVINAEGTTAGYGTPEALAGVEFWVNQVKDGVSPTQEQLNDTSGKTMFDSGKVAMIWDGSWAPAELATNEVVGKDIDVAPLPAGSAGNQSVIHGVANVANAKSKNLEAAKDFALFASGEEASKIVAEAGAVIPAYNGMQQTWQDSLPQYNLKVFIDALETAVPYPVSKNTKVWANQETEMFTSIWSLKVAPEEGLKELNTTMQAALDAEK